MARRRNIWGKGDGFNEKKDMPLFSKRKRIMGGMKKKPKPPRPTPPPPRRPATTLTPGAVTFDDETFGYLFTSVASGGEPNAYTYSKTGADASLFTVDSLTGETSAIAPIAAGSYSLHVVATNDGQTAEFPIDVTVSATAGPPVTDTDEHPTPSEDDLPAQVLYLDARVGGLWHAAVGSNVPGISIGQSLGAEPKNVMSALAGKGPTVVRVPAGNFTISQGVSFVGQVYWIGAVDGGNQPLTCFTGATNSTILFSNSSASTTTEGWARNFILGPTDAQLAANGVTYQQGGRAVQLSGAGKFSIINCIIRNIAEVGIYGSTATEWLSRLHLSLDVYDTDIYGCGTDAQEHNIYWHCGKLGFHRSHTHDTRGSHALKADCEELVIADSRLLRDTGIGVKGPNNHSAALNVSPACDVRVARSVIQHVDPSTENLSVVELISRGNAGGGFSTKTPPSEDIENDPGSVRDADGMFGHWASIGFAAGTSKNIEAVVAAAVSAGTTSLTLKFIASEGRKGTKALSTSTTYTIRIQRSDLSVQTITTAPTLVGTGTATIPVPGGVGAPGIALNAKVSIKVSTDGWDYRRVNERFWNSASPTYWWQFVKEELADIDHAKQNIALFQDNLFVINTPANSIKLIQQSTDAPFEYAGNQEGTRANLPFPPINRPGGATADWTHDANHGSWEEPLAGDGYPYYGRNGSADDFVFRFPLFWKDNGVALLAGTIGEQFQQTVTGGTYDALGNIQWLDADGNLNKVISTDGNRSPLPAFHTTTLSAQGNSGSLTIQVASIAGMADGQAFKIDMQSPRGSSRAVHITTIKGAPSGNTVTMADELLMDIPSGSAVSATVKAGDDPDNWIPPSAYPTR